MEIRKIFEEKDKIISAASCTTDCSAPVLKVLDDNYIELTKEENIPLLLVSVPYVVSEDAQKVYNYEFEIARQEGVDFIDKEVFAGQIEMERLVLPSSLKEIKEA